MELSQARKLVNSGIADLVVNDKHVLVDALNNNGVSVTYSDSDADIIFKTLQGNQLSKSFRNELTNMLASRHAKTNSMTRGFVAQQNVTPQLTLNDLSFGTINTTAEKPFTNSGTYSAADGTGSTAGDLLNAAVNVYSTNQLAQSQQQTADAVLKHDQNQILLQNQALALSAQDATTFSSKMKAYILPIIVVGVVVVGGLIVYKKYKK